MKITIEDVKAGLKKHKLKLAQGDMLSIDRKCTCGIGATVLKDFDELLSNSAIWDLARDKYGKEYVHGFWFAFDDVNHIIENIMFHTNDGKEGFRDGRNILLQAIRTFEKSLVSVELGLLC